MNAFSQSGIMITYRKQISFEHNFFVALFEFNGIENYVDILKKTAGSFEHFVEVNRIPNEITKM